jgi:DNA-binding MarR family transcriptional regulator
MFDKKKIRKTGLLMWTPNLNIQEVVHLGQSYINRQLKEIGLSSGLFFFIAELSQHEWLNMSVLSAAVGVDNAYATRSVSRLSTLGYVRKIRDEHDHRAFRVSLTLQGQKAAERVNQTLKQWIEIVSSGIPETEIETVNRVFDQMHQNALKHLKKEAA